MPNNIMRRFTFSLGIFLLISGPVISGLQNHSDNDTVLKAIESGKLAYSLTIQDEIIGLLGSPDEKKQYRDGGMLLLELKYGEMIFQLGKMKNSEAPFTLKNIRLDKKNLDIGQNKKVALRGNHDLNKIEEFWGLQNISLIHVDLRGKEEWLKKMPFDSLTVWPPPSRLPENFSPGEMLEQGKNPGLGIQSIHKQEITGKGVGIAVIDQPLLLGHEEYKSRISHYDAAGLEGWPPAMHSAPIASIAVGKEIGVAPGASLSFYAVPMWKRENIYYIRALRDIMKRNENMPEDEKIRVVSISNGAFRHYPDFEKLQAIMEQAEKAGIFIITCDTSLYPYATLTLIPGKDPNQASSYSQGFYGIKDPQLMIPTSNKTIASHRGLDVYTYERKGGMSWAAPYIAGLAALAFQVDPDIDPGLIWDDLVRTAVKSEAGPVVNPPGFLKHIKIRQKETAQHIKKLL